MTLMRILPIFILFLVVVFSLVRGNKNVESNAAPPDKEKSAKTKVLEAGAVVLQNSEPVDAINVYLDGFHFYNGDMGRQVEAHHYCGIVSEDFTQCLMYDGNGKDARLIGVEYVVSEKLFKTLPEDERKLWHSHVHEIKSGLLIAPGIPEKAEHELMEKLVSTYGKIWHTWHIDHKRKDVPLGVPALMMGFTADGQINPPLVSDRDKRFEVSTNDKRQSRKDIPSPQILPGANSWETGEILQLELTGQSNREKKTSHGSKSKHQQ